MAAEQLEGGYRSIAFLDLNYIFKKNYMGAPRDASPGAAAQSTLDQLSGIRESVDHVIVCVDSPPYRRKELFAEYKAQRERPSDEELAQKRWLLDRIQKDGYQIAKAKGFEADDCIATLCKAYHWCEDLRIVASDKDLAQCVGANVRMFVPSVGNRPAEIRGPEEIRAKYGVAPEDMGLWLALCGDSSDNIPGVPGVGPKKAAFLIENCVNLVGIAEMLASGKDLKPPAMWKSLADNWEQLVVSLKLTKLEDAPLDHVALLEKLEPEKLVEDESEDSVMNGESTSQTNGSVTDAEFDPISKAPENYVAPTPTLPKSEPPAAMPLVKTKPAEIVRGAVTADLQPTDIDSAWRLAKAFHESRMYAKYPTAEAVFTVLVKGRELGLKVTTALDCFSVIKGVPRASADLIQALCERDPDCEYFKLVETNSERAVYRIKRKSHDKPFPDFVYTMDDAKTAGLSSQDNYRKNPAAMMRARCKSTAGRAAFPGACCGLYCPEEMDAA